MQIVYALLITAIIVLAFTAYVSFSPASETQRDETFSLPATAIKDNGEPQNKNLPESVTESVIGESKSEDAGEYSSGEHSAEKKSYSDFIREEAVDDAAVKSHEGFVKDRLTTTGANIVGTTYNKGFSKGEMEGSELIPYVGLFRPQMVKVRNPDAVSEYNPNTYSEHQTIRWG